MLVDINCDLGEGIGFDEQIMPYISSCNIACGGHYGNKESIEETINLAKKYNLKIGCHPSYPDQTNFGRVSMVLPNSLFKSEIEKQLQLFFKIAKNNKVSVHHIKAHGALYNDLIINEKLCELYLEVLIPYKENISIYTPYYSKLTKLALKKGFFVTYEAFADRNYQSDLSLVSRKKENALLTDYNEVAEHVWRMISEGKVKTVENKLMPIQANTYCIHGDQENAAVIAKYLFQDLNKKGCIVDKL